MIIKFKIRGDIKVGDRYRKRGQLYEITEIVGQKDCYELDGVTYDDWPGEAPDDQWFETTVKARALTPDS